MGAVELDINKEINVEFMVVLLYSQEITGEFPWRKWILLRIFLLFFFIPRHFSSYLWQNILQLWFLNHQKAYIVYMRGPSGLVHCPTMINIACNTVCKSLIWWWSIVICPHCVHLFVFQYHRPNSVVFAIPYQRQDPSACIQQRTGRSLRWPLSIIQNISSEYRPQPRSKGLFHSQRKGPGNEVVLTSIR